MSGASRARRRALRAYLIELRDLMRLQAWDIDVIDRDPEGDDAILEIVPQPLRHYASVRVGTFFEVDRAEQRQTAVHELYHLVEDGLWDWIDNEKPWHSRIAPDLVDELKTKIQFELEVQADFVARALAPRMPMPPAWPK